MDLIESITNATLGLLISYALTLFWLGFDPAQSAVITAVFFIASTGRAYVLRRVFRRLENG